MADKKKKIVKRVAGVFSDAGDAAKKRAAKRAKGIARAKKLAAEGMAAETKKKKSASIAKGKAIQKNKDAKIASDLTRRDLGTPPGPPLKPVGVGKKGMTEKIAEAPVKRPSQQPKFTRKVSEKTKTQREWDGMTSAARRAEREKYRETGKSKFAALIKRGSAKTGGQGRKNKSREALLDKLGTFKKGGLVKTENKDFRKGGIFY